MTTDPPTPPAPDRNHYPDRHANGRIERRIYDPEQWTSNDPTPAFHSRQPDDE
jgi:hypothetical protein